jgi:hypothetical protein
MPTPTSPETTQPLHGHQPENTGKSANGALLNRNSMLDRQTHTSAATSLQADPRTPALDCSQTEPTRHLSAVSATSSSGKMSRHARTGAQSVVTPTTLPGSHNESRALDNVRRTTTAHPKLASGRFGGDIQSFNYLIVGHQKLPD